MGQLTEFVEALVGQIFDNRKTVELEAARSETVAIDRDLAARGMFNSGARVLRIQRAYNDAVTRVLDRTLDELAADFRRRGCRDPNSFWNAVAPVLKARATSMHKSLQATAEQKLAMTRGLAKGQQFSAMDQALITLPNRIQSRVEELRLRSQFVIVKTPEDRIAFGIPDVSIMMWFPHPLHNNPEEIQAATERYQAIKSAVEQASDGMATVNKFDDPDVVPQDRISASIENWLEKSVVVICDLGGNRPNVYYECGYARAIGTDVLLTVPVSEANSISLHLGHVPQIRYADINQLSTELVTKLSVLLSRYDLSGTGRT